jgi:hypothetical protein
VIKNSCYKIGEYQRKIKGKQMETKNSFSARLLFTSNLAIFTIGLGFAVRAAIAEDLRVKIFDVIDPAQSATMVGQALGMTFLGFAFTLLIGSALVDVLGSKRILVFSALSNLAGSLLVLWASIRPVDASSYTLVLIGLMLTGLGWGGVEGAVNPLVVSIDPANKIKRLNILHAWWPAGIVFGGLFSIGVKAAGLPWQTNLVVLCIPALAIVMLVRGQLFPVTERVAQGVSYADMCRELVRRPQFLIFLCCMWLTTSSELAPGQWVDLTLSHTVGMSGIFILIYVSTLMFVMRHFAGPIAHRLSSIGLLWLSSLLAAIGLFALSRAYSPVTAVLAATIWGAGVCFMWPTMLAVVSERFVRGGALAMGLMGFTGGMAIQFLLPALGKVFDDAKNLAAGGADKLATLSAEQSAQVIQIASRASFEIIALVPLLLLPIFGVIWWLDRRQAARAKN